MRICAECGFSNRLNFKKCGRCGSEIPSLTGESSLSPGSIVGKNGRYRVIEFIGGDDRFLLWKGEDLSRRRRSVVLKIFNPETGSIAKKDPRLPRFVRKLSSLSHPNLGSIVSLERENGLSFIVTEYIKGPALQRFLEQRGRLEEEEVFWVGREVCLGLMFLHSRNAAHGQMSLHSLYLNQKPKIEGRLPTIATSRSHPHECIKIDDWVISRLIHEIASGRKRITRSVWDPARDMRSLGIVMFHLLTGKRVTSYKSMKVVKDYESLSGEMKSVLKDCMTGPGNRNSACRMLVRIEECGLLLPAEQPA